MTKVIIFYKDLYNKIVGKTAKQNNNSIEHQKFIPVNTKIPKDISDNQSTLDKQIHSIEASIDIENIKVFNKKNVIKKLDMNSIDDIQDVMNKDEDCMKVIQQNIEKLIELECDIKV